MKICSRCNTQKPLSEFFSNKKRKDGVSTYCKECQLEYQRARYAQPEIIRKHKMTLEESKERRLLAMKKYRLKKLYSMTIEEYESMVESKDGRCWICNEFGTRTLHVDHDHSCCPGETSCGKCVRGLLCYKCNVLLGYANDDTNILQKAIDYIKDFS